MVLAYILLNFRASLGRVGLNEDTYTYNGLNFVGGGLASASAIIAGTMDSYPLAVLEGIWGVVGLIGLIRLLLRDVRQRQKVPEPPAHGMD